MFKMKKGPLSRQSHLLCLLEILKKNLILEGMRRCLLRVIVIVRSFRWDRWLMGRRIRVRLSLWLLWSRKDSQRLISKIEQEKKKFYLIQKLRKQVIFWKWRSEIQIKISHFESLPSKFVCTTIPIKVCAYYNTYLSLCVLQYLLKFVRTTIPI